ncbi:FliM/FliN family flagellar motor switch protein [bacterium]|nr:FliM/FliN family flagellar motor switch protein [bacterium]
MDGLSRRNSYRGKAPAAGQRSLSANYGPEGPEDLSILQDVPFILEAEMGSTSKKMSEILKLTQGSLLELDKEDGSPIDLKINGRLIARGEVVELDGCYAVRIIELVYQ